MSTGTALLCPKCKAVLFICTNKPHVLKNASQDILEGLADGLISRLMTTNEFRQYEKEGRVGCNCVIGEGD